MDYDLSRLSSRSFEQLVQALAERKFGPGVVVFGDGADGGREATFGGSTTYAPHGPAWDGSVVFQAKFRQRPLGTTIDGPWALDELKGELNKFAEQKGDRPRPDYFVFVTNAVLSPGTGGHKDQATQALDDARAAWGLVDYDVWDYDKLRTFLDNDDQLRTRWGWITAGDVLGAVLAQLQGSTPSFQKTMVNYLEKTLKADRYVRLEEAGHEASEKTALSRVFVDLPLVGGDSDQPELCVRRLLDCTAERHGADYSNGPPSDWRVVLVGGPGQGKTTLGQFACQIFRASLLASSEGQALTTEGAEAIAAIRLAAVEAGLEFERAPRFPMRVVLTDLARWLEAGQRPLLAYMAHVIQGRVGSQLDADLLRTWLGSYPWFIVLDGLDEVPANAGRDKVMECIDDFWVDAAQERADIVVLATTRPQGYNNDFGPDHFAHLHLAELSRERALDYGRRLASARYADDPDQISKVCERLELAAGGEATEHLMRSPLQVTIMTALVDQYGKPPRERWGLFNAYYDVIYKREREREHASVGILHDHRPEVDAIHRRVGLALQVLTTHEGHSDPRLTGDQLTRVVDARLSQEGHVGERREQMLKDIRAAAELRLVFLVGAEEDRIGFEIRSLQEFMAAGALVDGPDDVVIQRLRAIAPLPAWRNVVLFAAGECFIKKQHLRSDIVALCRELDIVADDPVLGATRTGARLALDLLEDRVAARQPTQLRLLTKHAFEALDVSHSEVPLRLARCHNEETDEIYREQLQRLLAGLDPFACTRARRCLIGLHAQGVSWADPLLRTSLPGTSDEAYEMLDELPGSLFDALEPSVIAQCVGAMDFQALSFLNESRNLSTFAPYLTWAGFGARSVGVSVQHGGVTFYIVSVRRVGDGTESGLPISIPNGSAVVICRAAEQFVEDPTNRALAAALDEIAAGSSSDDWRHAAFQMPWPLGHLLGRAGDSAELRAIAQELRERPARAGTAWEEAERRWVLKGIRVAEAVADDPAFPLSVAGWAVGHNADGDVPKQLLADVRALRAMGSQDTAEFARTALWIILRRALLPGVGAGDVVELLSLASDREAFFDTSLLYVRRDGERDLEDVLAAMGADSHFIWSGEETVVDNDVLRQLEDLVTRNPTARVIEAYAFALADSRVGRRHSTLVQLDQETPELTALAAWIAFEVGDRTRTAEELGRAMAAGIDEGAASLLRASSARGSSGFPEFLVGLQRELPLNSPFHRLIQHELASHLSRRETPLAREDVWHRLKLFDPHPLALVQ